MLWCHVRIRRTVFMGVLMPLKLNTKQKTKLGEHCYCFSSLQRNTIYFKELRTDNFHSISSKIVWGKKNHVNPSKKG